MNRLAPGASPRLLACIAVVGLLGLAGCDGNATPTGQHPSGLAVWNAKTEALCREKQEAIADLGSVHITYGGIARLGLPAVKGLLTRYLDRLVAVLRHFAARRQQLTTPASRVSVMTKVTELDGEVQAATVHLRTELAGVTSAPALSGAFRIWLTALQRLGARGETLAQQLKLPACESARPAAAHVSS